MGQTLPLRYNEYEKALQEQEAKRLETTQKHADSLYDQSVKQAEIQRGQAMAAADSAFERSKSTYGLTAEYLAQSGLANSGYSDNLMRDAYAVRQSGYSAAGTTYADLIDAAERTKADAYLNAELDYNDRTSEFSDRLVSYRQQINDAYNLTIDSVESGTAKKTLDEIIRANGFDYAQAAGLYKKAGWNPISEADYGALFGETALPNENQTTPSGEDLSDNARDYLNSLSENLFKIGVEGGVSIDDYKANIDALLGDNAASNTAFDNFLKQSVSAHGGAQNDTRIVADILYGKGIIDETKYNEIKNSLSGGGGGEEVGGEEVGGGLSDISVKRGLKLREGDNFKVEVKNGDGSTDTYKVQVGSRSTDVAVENAGRDVADEGFFYYNGTLYIKKNNEIWSVEKRDVGRQVSYAEMINKVTEGLDLSGVKFSITHSNGTGNGDNITFTDSLGNEYKVQIDKKTSNAGAIKLAERYDAQVPFKYGEEVFVKLDDGNVYKIEPRSFDTGKQTKMYENLLNALGRYQPEKPVDTGSTKEPDNVVPPEKPVDTGSTKEPETGGERSYKKIHHATVWSGMGNNFGVSYGGQNYSVQAGSLASEEVISRARTKGLESKDIFEMDGQLYIYIDPVGYGYGNVYELEPRKVLHKGDYASLLKALGMGES